ncbi:DUF4129 domain-containing protein [Streptomyces sp. NBC_00669]|uniref:DUF4129 domain-containing protein n=1 Tax=Streptomyces sp. NBC_00669 TaxID=2976011 RepID=UPI002E302D7B|nr:DUF4129 domain-containing protein [Streptomyces sp. NBC_00669]
MGRRALSTRGVPGDTRTALVVVVVAGTVLAALVLRPGSVGRGAGVVRSGPAVALLAIGWAVGCLALLARYRVRPRIDTRLSPVEQRLAAVVRATLLVGAAAVPAAVLAMHRFGSPYDPGPLEPGEFGVGHPRPSRDLGHDTPHNPPPWLIVTLLVVAGVALVAAFVVAYRRLRAEYVRGPRRARRDPHEDARLLADAVESGRRALRDNGDARTAVIACYVAMETSLAGSGVSRHVSDSPNDLLVRAAASGLRTEGSASVLTELFREARYSSHPMGDAHRAQAADALADLAERLAAPRTGARAEEGA